MGIYMNEILFACSLFCTYNWRDRASSVMHVALKKKKNSEIHFDCLYYPNTGTSNTRQVLERQLVCQYWLFWANITPLSTDHHVIKDRYSNRCRVDL